ncbi:MAG: exopolysaccharide biosynthesis protein [Alteromonadaceae bacterium]|nr:MAG: exopolysaccharide biosynthesis protein [Alteromonadaceae bacterium]
MHRIQKAVNKAKGEHVPEPPAQSPEEINANSLEALRYSRTKVLPAHPDVLADNRVIASFADNVNGQIFRTLRTQVIQKMRENNWRSLAITSPTEGEGKSLIAANLAIAIALEVNQTVLLVDMNLRNPTLAKRFGIKAEHGLIDCIQGKVELQDILVNPGLDRLVLVPGRGSIGSTAEIISSPKMVSFFKEARERYQSRIVIYDMPAILPTDDVLSSIGNIDSALLVLEDGKNSEKDILRAVRQLQKTTVIGTIVNKYHKGSWVI